MRDLRDPEILGHLYRAARGRGLSIEESCKQRAPIWEDEGRMSNDPTKHHSRTPQKIGDLNDGGTP